MRLSFESRTPTLRLLAFFAGFALAVSSRNAFAEQSDDSSPSGPLSAAESLERLKIAPGLRIDLIAVEPQVIDPVAIRFDERGQLWVVEMRDYPNGPNPGQPPMSGRIRILQDKDGDGRFEHSQVFADKLLFATGVQPWREGAIVTLAGKVAFFKDTTGDGAADHREVWYQGFAEANPQLRANHPTLGLDNYIYVANGLRGGSVVDVRDKKAPKVPISGRDFRFHPLKNSYEAVSGVGQFGLTFDDFGNRFVCSNRNPMMHVVLPNRYLKRNQAAAIPGITHDVMTAGAESRIFPLSRAWTTSTLHAGQFTAACGVTVFRGDLLPKGYRGDGFTCDPTGNLVHREKLTPSGATFSARRTGAEGVEFLASSDEWFRPVNMTTGPDGALYVVDMYRAVIEHPQWVPDELKNRRDERYGDDRGRIYRIARADAVPGRLPNLVESSPQDLVADLSADNGWRAETASRLLYQRQTKSVVEPLSNMAARGATPESRVRALWLLDGLNQITLPTVVSALADEHPRVREQAVVLAEKWVEETAIRARVRSLAEDRDARVRFQVALSLTPAKSPEDVQALAKVAVAGGGDVWTRRAVKVAAGSQAAPVALAVLDLLKKETTKDESDTELLRDVLAAAAAQAKPEERAKLLAGIHQMKGPGQESSRPQFVALRALSSRRATLATILNDVEDKELRTGVEATVKSAVQFAMDPGAAEPLRLDAIELLSQVNASEVPLTKLALDGEPKTLRLQAIAALSGRALLEPWRVLVGKFSAESPLVRRAILDGVLGRSDRIELLLAAIEEGRIKPAEIDRVRTDRLLKLRDSKLQKRVRQLFADAIPADRKKVLADYQDSLKLTADAKRGVLVFRKNCATCHRINDIGVDVAPDIADSRTRKPSQLLTDILQPNRAIDSNYVSYTVITDDGRSLSGILSSESAAGVTLKQPEGKSVTLPRAEIEELRSNGISLMPEGLEKNISKQQMADLISFIKNWRYLDGRTPLAEPPGKKASN